MTERTELDIILTKIECGLGTGNRDFYVMARDRLREYINKEKETYKHECPDCEEMVEGCTEGGV